jgi:hypothetical protein
MGAGQQRYAASPDQFRHEHPSATRLLRVARKWAGEPR